MILARIMAQGKDYPRFLFTSCHDHPDQFPQKHVLKQRTCILLIHVHVNRNSQCYISNRFSSFPRPLPLVLIRHCQLASIHLSRHPSAASALGPFVSQQLLVPL